MKNLSLKTIVVFTIFLSMTACIPRGDFGFESITQPKPTATVLEATAAALNAATSVTSATCANGTQGLRVILEDGTALTVACGGNVGATGATGATGAAGPQGAQGPEGPQGIQGVAGSGADKKMAVYDASGAATGLIYVTSYTNSLIVLHHPATGMNIAYNMPWSADRPNMIPGTTNSIYFESANCSGQGYQSFGSPVGNTVFKDTVQNKYYKYTGLYRTDLAMNSRLNGSNCLATTPSSAGFVAIEEVTLPAGVSETLKQPVTLKYE